MSLSIKSPEYKEAFAELDEFTKGYVEAMFDTDIPGCTMGLTDKRRADTCHLRRRVGSAHTGGSLRLCCVS